MTLCVLAPRDQRFKKFPAVISNYEITILRGNAAFLYDFSVLETNFEVGLVSSVVSVLIMGSLRCPWMLHHPDCDSARWR